jgi:hypothetical protein
MRNAYIVMMLIACLSASMARGEEETDGLHGFTRDDVNSSLQPKIIVQGNYNASAVSSDKFREAVDRMERKGNEGARFWAYDPKEGWKKDATGDKATRWVYDTDNGKWLLDSGSIHPLKNAADAGFQIDRSAGRSYVARDASGKLIAAHPQWDGTYDERHLWGMTDASSDKYKADKWFATGANQYEALQKSGTFRESFWRIGTGNKWEQVDRDAAGAQPWLYNGATGTWVAKKVGDWEAEGFDWKKAK